MNDQRLEVERDHARRMRDIGSVRDIAIKYAVVFVLAVVLGLVLRWCSNLAHSQAPLIVTPNTAP